MGANQNEPKSAKWPNHYNCGWKLFGEGRRSSKESGIVPFFISTKPKYVFGEKNASVFHDLSVPLGHHVKKAVNFPRSQKYYLNPLQSTTKGSAYEQGGESLGVLPIRMTSGCEVTEMTQVIIAEFTHLLLFEGEVIDVLGQMKELIPCTHIGVGGFPDTIVDHLVRMSDKGPVIILEHTGGAADVSQSC
jgi:hypothetical protein